MHITDPVGDMVTRIRNAVRAGHDKVTLPSSKMKLSIAKVLQSEGFISDVIEHQEGVKKEITLVLKYGPNRQSTMTSLKRISRPGLRRYVNVAEIPWVLDGLGIAILSTSKGILADSSARKQKVGGELLCTVC